MKAIDRQLCKRYIKAFNPCNMPRSCRAAKVNLEMINARPVIKAIVKPLLGHYFKDL
jgi:hypothetical protein